MSSSSESPDSVSEALGDDALDGVDSSSSSSSSSSSDDSDSSASVASLRKPRSRRRRSRRSSRRSGGGGSDAAGQQQRRRRRQRHSHRPPQQPPQKRTRSTAPAHKDTSASSGRRNSVGGLAPPAAAATATPPPRATPMRSSVPGKPPIRVWHSMTFFFALTAYTVGCCLLAAYTTPAAGLYGAMLGGFALAGFVSFMFIEVYMSNDFKKTDYLWFVVMPFFLIFPGAVVPCATGLWQFRLYNQQLITITSKVPQVADMISSDVPAAVFWDFSRVGGGSRSPTPENVPRLLPEEALMQRWGCVPDYVDTSRCFRNCRNGDPKVNTRSLQLCNATCVAPIVVAPNLEVNARNNSNTSIVAVASCFISYTLPASEDGLTAQLPQFPEESVGARFTGSDADSCWSLCSRSAEDYESSEVEGTALSNLERVEFELTSDQERESNAGRLLSISYAGWKATQYVGDPESQYRYSILSMVPHAAPDLNNEEKSTTVVQGFGTNRLTQHAAQALNSSWNWTSPQRRVPSRLWGEGNLANERAAYRTTFTQNYIGEYSEPGPLIVMPFVPRVYEDTGIGVMLGLWIPTILIWMAAIVISATYGAGHEM